MKKVLIGLSLVAGVTMVTPVMAQGVYIGPNGVGVDSGLGYGYGRRNRDRDYDRDYRDSRRDRFYEGRSNSDRRYRRDYDDRY